MKLKCWVSFGLAVGVHSLHVWARALCAAPDIPGWELATTGTLTATNLMVEKSYFYSSVPLREYHLDKFSIVAKNANSSILWWNNPIIGKIATDRLHPPGEYGLGEPCSAELQSNTGIEELQSRKHKVKIKTSVIIVAK